jgi:hypothetical protein
MASANNLTIINITAISSRTYQNEKLLFQQLKKPTENTDNHDKFLLKVNQNKPFSCLHYVIDNKSYLPPLSPPRSTLEIHVSAAAVLEVTTHDISALNPLIKNSVLNSKLHFLTNYCQICINNTGSEEGAGSDMT